MFISKENIDCIDLFLVEMYLISHRGI